MSKKPVQQLCTFSALSVHVKRTLRIGLPILGILSVVWTSMISVQAGQAEEIMENQTAVAMQQEEVIRIENITGLDDEFEALEEESVLIVEEVERYRREARRKTIQRGVVIMLVIAIFGVGIIPGVVGKKKRDPLLMAAEESETEKSKVKADRAEENKTEEDRTENKAAEKKETGEKETEETGGQN